MDLKHSCCTHRKGHQTGKDMHSEIDNAEGQKISLMIVDDDIMLLDMLRTGLSLQGYHCETVTSARCALELSNKTSFDIMIADIALPDMHGFELVKRAKKLRPDLAVIIMTGFINEFSYDEAMEAGASDFIKKPFSLKEIEIRIKQVTMQTHLSYLSLHDDLTGLYNRRGFFTLVEHQLKLCKRQKRRLYMFYADLDDLKQINDTRGHQEGDLALIETANILKNIYRESDIIARIGGDEFVAIIESTEEDCVGTITVRLKEAIETYNSKSNRGYGLSVSVGVAYYDPERPSSIDELLAQADKSMYEHKFCKQNR